MARRFRVGSWPLVGLFLLAPGLSAGLISAQSVHGRVLEVRTDEPVAAAVVELLPAAEDGEPLTRVLADEEGRFLLQAPETGTYRLRAGRIGLRTVTTERFDLVRGEDPLEVEVLVAVDAVPLAALVIVSERPPRLHLGLHVRGFYERRRTWGREGMGFGHFFDREEIERRNPFQPSDLLLTVPGVRIVGGGGRARQITLRTVPSARHAIYGDGCVPTIFVDGAPATSGIEHPGGPVDELISISDLVGVEVYPGLTMPAEFTRSLGGELCGAIVFWTGAGTADGTGGLHRAVEDAPGTISLELRLGSGIGAFAPMASRLHWAPRGGGRITLDWQASRRVAVYWGISRTPFGCERELCRDPEVRFVSRGTEAGLRGNLDVWGGPWLQLGVVLHGLRMSWEESGQPMEASTGSRLGVGTAAGFQVPLGRGFSLTPGVQLVRYTTPDEVRVAVLGAGLRRSF